MCFETMAAAAGVVDLGMSLFGASEAKKAGREAARAEERATRESVRRIDRAREIQTSNVRAQAGASGVSVSSQSVLEVLDDLATEYERERTFTRSVGASRARTARNQGDAAAMQFYGRSVRSAVNLLDFAHRRWGE